MMNEKIAVTQGLDELREGKERAEYERDGLEAKLQRAQQKRGKCSDAVNRVPSGVGELQRLLKKDYDDYPNHLEDHLEKICPYLGTLLAERVAEARGDQIRESCSVAAFYIHT